MKKVKIREKVIKEENSDKEIKNNEMIKKPPKIKTKKPPKETQIKQPKTKPSDIKSY